MKDRFRILSIDFDFFVNTSKSIIAMCYPDGVDVPTELSKLIWAQKYIPNTTTYNILSHVDINYKLFEQCCSIIAKQDKSIPVLIAQSHKEIYDFICSNVKFLDPIDIVNIDFHHDLFNDNEEIDCGNWLRHAKHNFDDCKIHWIARKESLEIYNISEEERSKIGIEYDFDTIKDGYFDMLFLCRSDPWVPPHLDVYFDEMVNVISSFSDSAIIQTCVLEPRDIIPLVNQEVEFFKEVIARKEGNLNVSNNTATE